MQSPSKKKRFWRRESKAYPHACTSLGSLIGVFHERYWWHAAGEARANFDSIEDEILEKLRTAFTDTYSSAVHFDLFMIGKSKDSATPTIMFFSEEKEARKTAKKVFEEAGLLDRLPGFRVGHQTRQPAVGSLIQPAAESDKVLGHTRPDAFTEVFYDPSRPIAALGMPIFVRHNQNVLKQATANVVFDGKKCVYMSVTHIFVQNEQATQEEPIDSDEEYDYGSDTDDQDDLECVNITSRGSLSSLDEVRSSTDCLDVTVSSPASRPNLLSKYSRLAFLTSKTSAASSLPSESDPHLAVATPQSIENLKYLGRLSWCSFELDCALIDILSAEIYEKVLELATQRTHVDLDHPQSQDLVYAHTANNIISGQLSRDAKFVRLPGSSAFQKVWQVSLQAPLDWGDCGVLFLGFASNEPRGYVVTASLSKSIAFIIPVTKAFDSMQVKWGMPRSLSSRTSAGNPEEKGLCSN